MSIAFPFSAIVGQDEMKQSILIAAVDPLVGGYVARVTLVQQWSVEIFLPVLRLLPSSFSPQRQLLGVWMRFLPVS